MKRIILLISYFLISHCASAQTNDITLYVANHKGEIKTVSMGVTECFMVKETISGEWQNYNGVIDGFKYKEGYDYELQVEKVKAINPPADLPLFNYKLKSVISKKPTMIISTHNRKHLDGSKFILKKMRTDNKIQTISDELMIISFMLNDNKVSGNDGCNDFFGRIEINKNKISFSNLGATKKFCPDTDLDKNFNMLIKDIDSYKISSKILKFYKGKKLLLEYHIVN
jgi:heat shock protein HslJ